MTPQGQMVETGGGMRKMGNPPRSSYKAAATAWTAGREDRLISGSYRGEQQKREEHRRRRFRQDGGGYLPDFVQ